MSAEVIFIVSVALIAYTYCGYSLVAYILGLVFGKPVRQADITPTVSIIITARNEERDIAAKIKNALGLDYPQDKLEIIVASDCSTDQTDDIVRGFLQCGVRLLRPAVRLGKTAAQNQAVRLSSGEILVFSDATTQWRPDAVRKIVRSFADPDVGCVAGQLVYLEPASSAVGEGCRAYWHWERRIKYSESLIGSLIGVSGCLYAVRRSCHRPLSGDMIDDFVIASEMRLTGLRTVYDPEAVALEFTNTDRRDEFHMRVRVIQQTMNALYRYQKVLSLRRCGMFAFQMISHKLLRYSAPLFIGAAYVSSLVLLKEAVLYELVSIGFTLFTFAALTGWSGDRLGLKLGPLVAIPYYFMLANLASVVAFVKFMRGDSRATWEPVRETAASKPIT